jgi:hypothetical protein
MGAARYPTSPGGRHAGTLGDVTGFRLAADAVALSHLGFVGFLVAGGFLARRRPGVTRAHLCALAVSAAIYGGGLDCPLTDLEKSLRHRAGGPVYSEGFIAHYLVSPVHPAGMTDSVGTALFGVVVALTVVAYGPRLARGAGLIRS